MKKLILLPLGAVVTLLCGCTNTTELLFSQSNTKAAAIFWNSDTAQVIQIGSADYPYTEVPELKIRVDGKIIFDSLSSIPEELIAQHESNNAEQSRGIGGHPSSRTLKSEKTWGAGALTVDLLAPSKRDTNLSYDEARSQDVCIIVQNSKIRAIRIVDFRYDPKNSMIELKFGDSPWINSRLTRKECIELFGNPADEKRCFTE
jgi:hypothetical protein